MCLAVPGQILELLDDGLAKVDFTGVRRNGQRRLHARRPSRATGCSSTSASRSRQIDEDEAKRDARAARRGDRRGVCSKCTRVRGSTSTSSATDARREAIAAEIRTLVEPGSHVKLMEVCGGHTHAIYRHGLEALLPDEVELVHGPGCPVCVIPMGRVDDAISLAERPRGDASRASATCCAFPAAGAARCSRRRRAAPTCASVYSPLDALALARREPEREVVFFGVGFETTAPATALTLLRARREHGVGTSPSSATTC